MGDGDKTPRKLQPPAAPVSSTARRPQRSSCTAERNPSSGLKNTPLSEGNLKPGNQITASEWSVYLFCIWLPVTLSFLWLWTIRWYQTSWAALATLNLNSCYITVTRRFEYELSLSGGYLTLGQEHCCLTSLEMNEWKSTDWVLICRLQQVLLF